jgi:hypothetical protein
MTIAGLFTAGTLGFAALLDVNEILAYGVLSIFALAIVLTALIFTDW